MGNFFEFLRTNITHVLPIILAGAVGFAIVLERTWALLFFYPMKHVPQFFDKLRDLVMADRLGEAISLCDRYKGKPLAGVVREALLRAHQPEPLIQDGLEIAVSEATDHINKRTGFLAMIANVSTLLGLLGTIVGLIHSFEAISGKAAQEKAALLAAGIATAMNATMMGLAVAIPCMVAFSFLMNRTNRMASELDRGATKILDLINQRFYSSDTDSQGSVQKAV